MKLNSEITKGLFGIEIEEHRVDVSTGTLSEFSHNKKLGNRRTQPYFQTDFSESMEELITPPNPTIEDSYQQLHNLQKVLQSSLNSQEIIWPFSMPPKMSTNNLNYLKNHFERDWYADYRKTLIKKYGLFQHIMCGIHVSYSPTEKIILDYQKEQNFSDYQEAKNQLLFNIARQLSGYRWLFTYLFGAAIQDFNENDNIPNKIKANHPFVKSWRSSQYGFANQPNIQVSYDNLKTFKNSIQNYINTDQLFAKSEFYGPVRLKTLKGNPETQIDYLEFRMLDNNPFSAEGLDIRTLYFIHLMIMDVLVNYRHWTQAELEENKKYNNMIAISKPEQPLDTEYMIKANQLIKRLKNIATQIDNYSYQSSIKWIELMLNNPDCTIAGKLFKAQNETQLGIKLGIKHKQFFQKNKFIGVPDKLTNIYQQMLCQGAIIKKITSNSIIIETKTGAIKSINKL